MANSGAKVSLATKKNPGLKNIPSNGKPSEKGITPKFTNFLFSFFSFLFLYFLGGPHSHLILCLI
jgi:hypothetical protein